MSLLGQFLNVAGAIGVFLAIWYETPYRIPDLLDQKVLVKLFITQSIILALILAYVFNYFERKRKKK